MTQIAYIFPGQGSQSVGMMSDWGDHSTLVKNLFDEASSFLNFDLLSMVQNGPVDDLNQTQNTQPAMLVSGIACFKIWQQETDYDVNLMAGHSFRRILSASMFWKISFCRCRKAGS